MQKYLTKYIFVTSSIRTSNTCFSKACTSSI